MQENKQYRQRTDVLHQEQIQVEEPSAQRTPVGKLLTHQLMRHKPSDKDTCQESDDRQEYLSRHEVKDVKQRFLPYPATASKDNQ